MAASHPARARAPWCRRPICSGVSAYLLPTSRFILLFCFSLTVASQCLRNDARLPRVTRPRVAPLSLEAAFFGPRRLSACGPSEGCSGGDAFRSPVGKRAVSPPEMVSHVYTGARPLCRALLQGAPSQCSSQLGGLPADGRDSAQPCPPAPHSATSSLWSERGGAQDTGTSPLSRFALLWMFRGR